MSNEIQDKKYRRFDLDKSIISRDVIEKCLEVSEVDLEDSIELTGNISIGGNITILKPLDSYTTQRKIDTAKATLCDNIKHTMYGEILSRLEKIYVDLCEQEEQKEQEGEFKISELKLIQDLKFKIWELIMLVRN